MSAASIGAHPKLATWLAMALGGETSVTMFRRRTVRSTASRVVWRLQLPCVLHENTQGSEVAVRRFKERVAEHINLQARGRSRIPEGDARVPAIT